MAVTRREAPAGSNAAQWVFMAIPATILLAVAAGWLALVVTSPSEVPGNPFEAVFRAARGEVEWTPLSTAFAVFEGLIVVGIIVAIALVRGRGPGSRPVDRATSTMAPTKQLGSITGAAARKKAEGLSNRVTDDPSTHGVLIGRTVNRPHRDIRMSWEDTAVMFAGQRMGKTSSIVATSILGAPGPVLTTSNKGDIVDITKDTRARAGKLWLFDLQGIAGQAGEIAGDTGDTAGKPGASFWFNPLASITTTSDARRVAGYFVGAASDSNAKVDSYFDGGARELLALTMLAAAEAGGDLLHVKQWLGADHDDTPSQILTIAGHTDGAQRLLQTSQLTSRQKDGLYDMARRFLDVLSDKEYAKAVLPQRRKKIATDGQKIHTSDGEQIHQLEEFDPVAFVESRDTLYALSADGVEAPTALTTAIVGRVFEVVQEVARTKKGRRLPVPLLAVLDECANCVRLENLPNLFSYLGSQGCVPIAVFQSQAQAERRWGKDGIDALVTSSNFHVYGGGIDDEKYLEQLSRVVGHHRVATASTSWSANGGSQSRQWSRERILDVEDLAALPVDRALVLSSGNPPVLARKIFWQNTDLAVKKEAADAR